MTWQLRLEQELAGRLPDGASHDVTGSARNPEQLDGWSDLDLHIHLPVNAEAVDLLAGLDVWAATDMKEGDTQVLRVVLVDGRRVDLVADGGRIQVPSLAADNEIRMLAALAVTKLGRDDRLIGLHLTLELMRLSLVQAMLLRDRACGTRVHRTGSDVDVLAEEILAVARGTLDVFRRPNVVEQVVRLYGCWRRQLEPGYIPDWSGLDALIDQGLRG